MPAIPPERQFVCEIYVRSLPASLSFFHSLGFVTVRSEPHFAVISYPPFPNHVFLEEIPESRLPPKGTPAVANIRVMVEDVDAVYERVKKVDGVVVRNDIADKYYGLRDFTVEGPDGVGVRFGMDLVEGKE